MRKMTEMIYKRVLSRGIRYCGKYYHSPKLTAYYGKLMGVKVCGGKLAVYDVSGNKVEVFTI